MMLFTDHVRNRREGNVFRGVDPSIHLAGGGGTFCSGLVWRVLGGGRGGGGGGKGYVLSWSCLGEGREYPGQI